MQVAEILSDITSLRACGHTEALALVNGHKSVPKTLDTAAGEPGLGNKNEDLRRAKELVELHYEFKARHANGEVDDALRVAREDVERVLWELS